MGLIGEDGGWIYWRVLEEGRGGWRGGRVDLPVGS